MGVLGLHAWQHRCTIDRRLDVSAEIHLSMNEQLALLGSAIQASTSELIDHLSSQLTSEAGRTLSNRFLTLLTRAIALPSNIAPV
jgi:hypothetical protein